MGDLGLAVLLCFGAVVGAATDSERVLLREVQTLTLYNGRYTHGRRASPVPQMQCVGGTAGCNSFVPQVVQCYNKGWDGYDVQWECKADMDIAYRFGAVTVSCEGYNFPEDPYILRGSCGLEYVLDLTEEGLHRPKANSEFVHRRSKYENPTVFSNPSNIIVVLLLFGLAYLMYMICLRSQQNGSQSRPQCDEDFHSTAGPSAWPPPPGFKPTYTGYTTNDGFQSKTSQGFGGYQADRSSGPGFWTGVGAGGLLGYLFGNRSVGEPNIVLLPVCIFPLSGLVSLSSAYVIDLNRAVHFMNTRGEVLHFAHSKNKRVIGNLKTQEAELCQALVEQKEDKGI